MSDEKLLEVVDLQAGYNGMAVVHDVSFSVREGEILAILGSNGSGKTTTLRAITCLLYTSQRLPAKRSWKR